MDVADRIAVMSEGHVEQVGGPRELYERPATPFVMEFLGPVTRLGSELVRPHDVKIAPLPEPGSSEAQVTRVAHLGFEVRVELALADGGEADVQLTKAQADELELAAGDIVHVRSVGGRARIEA